jgi:hypothetical protein
MIGVTNDRRSKVLSTFLEGSVAPADGASLNPHRGFEDHTYNKFLGVLGLFLGKILSLLKASEDPHLLGWFYTDFLKSGFSLFALSYNISNKNQQDGLSFRGYSPLPSFIDICFLMAYSCVRINKFPAKPLFKEGHP